MTSRGDGPPEEKDGGEEDQEIGDEAGILRPAAPEEGDLDLVDGVESVRSLQGVRREDEEDGGDEEAEEEHAEVFPSPLSPPFLVEGLGHVAVVTSAGAKEEHEAEQDAGDQNEERREWLHGEKF